MGGRTGKNIAVFLDRDGTIVHERNYLSEIKDVKVFSGVPEGLKLLKKAGFKLVIVTNQSGIGRGYFTETKMHSVHRYLLGWLKKKGAVIDAVYYCPHHPDFDCACRKPKLGMVLKAKKRFNLDLKKSYVIGDHVKDFLLARNMGGKGVFLLTGHGKDEYKKIMSGKVSRPDRVEKNFRSAVKWILEDKK